MINRRRLMRRMSVVVALAVVMALVAGAPALQAQPEAGTIAADLGVQVWNGHNCPANVPIRISGLNAGMGGYETKLDWPVGRFGNSPANVGVTLTNYLAVNGRSSSGTDGTPLLKAVVGDTVKFGDYSWGPSNPPGNSADGQLATVSLFPTATCGLASPLNLTETQLVDINGNVIALTAQGYGSVNVYGRFDTNGDGIPVVLGTDVLAVVNMLGMPIDPNCGLGYQFDVNLDGIPVVLGTDVLATVNELGNSACQ